jgi:hypothetical protein
MDCNMDCRPRPVNRCFLREAGAGRRVTAGHRRPTGSGDSRQASARRARRAPARAGRGTTRAALIYQHRTAERDRLIAAAISQIEAELADPQSPAGT